MTLNDILVSVLAQLDRGHDSQTLDIWRYKLTCFANEALADLARVIQPRRTDTLPVEQGAIDTQGLPRFCEKILSIQQGSKGVPFYYGVGSNIVRVPGVLGEVEVTYRYTPQVLSSPTDTPELPGYCHGLIVTYVVGRERAAGDVSTQRGANVYFEMYNDGKKKLRPQLGEVDAYRIQNRW